MKFSEYIKKHYIITLILVFLPVFAVIIAFVFKIHFRAEHWLNYFGAVLAYYGTVSLSAVALFQAEKANEIAQQANNLSEKVYMQSQRAYLTIFAIDKVKEFAIHDCQYDEEKTDDTGVRTCRMILCRVDSNPGSCQAITLTITNCGEYPISYFKITNKYLVGRNHTEETISREKDTIIAPHKSLEVTICDTPHFRKYRSNIVFEVLCRNIFGNEMAQQVEISGCDADHTLKCICKEISNHKSEC